MAAGEWLEQQASPPLAESQETKATKKLTHPKDENVPTQELQTEQKRLRVDDAKLAASPMKAPEDLAVQMADKTNEQLVEMFKRPNDWLPEALHVARAELQRRGIDAGTIIAGPPPMQAGCPLFFPVSPLKLVVMSIITLNTYELYWFYKNWKLIKQRTDSNIMPFCRPSKSPESICRKGNQFFCLSDLLMFSC